MEREGRGEGWEGNRIEGKGREWKGRGGRKKARGRDGRPGGRAPQNFWARTATDKVYSKLHVEMWRVRLLPLA
jgi:hypothetical protein